VHFYNRFFLHLLLDETEQWKGSQFQLLRRCEKRSDTCIRPLTPSRMRASFNRCSRFSRSDCSSVSTHPLFISSNARARCSISYCSLASRSRCHQQSKRMIRVSVRQDQTHDTASC
jgi:hypothetical protein